MSYNKSKNAFKDSAKEQQTLKVNDLVTIKYLFSKEEPYIGIITEIVDDLNFSKVFRAITNKGSISAPLGVAEIVRID